jgi:hypothetical protein
MPPALTPSMLPWLVLTEPPVPKGEPIRTADIAAAIWQTKAVDLHEELVAAERSAAPCFGDERLPGDYVCQRDSLEAKSLQAPRCCSVRPMTGDATRADCPFLAVWARPGRSLKLRPCLPFSGLEMTAWASVISGLFAASYYTSETGDPIKTSSETKIRIRRRRPPAEET